MRVWSADAADTVVQHASTVSFLSLSVPLLMWQGEEEFTAGCESAKTVQTGISVLRCAEVGVLCSR